MHALPAPARPTNVLHLYPLPTQAGVYLDTYAQQASLPQQQLQAAREMGARAVAAHLAAHSTGSQGPGHTGSAQGPGGCQGPGGSGRAGWGGGQAGAVEAYQTFLAAVTILARAQFAGRVLPYMLLGCTLLTAALLGHTWLLARCAQLRIAHLTHDCWKCHACKQ